jgi:hypothetical protein
VFEKHILKCPACFRGTITDGKCDRCGVTLATGSMTEKPRQGFRGGERPGKRPTFEGKPTLIGDYVQTKEDKNEK